MNANTLKLTNCENDLVSSGAIIMDASLDADDESAHVVVKVNEKSDFIQRFSLTESYELSIYMMSNFI